MSAFSLIAAVGAGVVVLSICFFFIHLAKLSPEHHLAFRTRSKPGKVANFSVLVPLIISIFWGPEGTQPLFVIAIAVYSGVSIPIQHLSLLQQGLPRRWVALNSGASIIGLLGMSTIALAFAQGFRV